MFGKNQSAQKAIETLIGAKASIVGNVEFAGGLRIDGKVKGEVRASDGQPSFLVISELATVEGSVMAAQVIVNGVVTGPIRAEVLELQPKARITGDVCYRVLEMHNGAIVEGALKHEDVRPELKLLAGGAN